LVLAAASGPGLRGSGHGQCGGDVCGSPTYAVSVGEHRSGPAHNGAPPAPVTPPATQPPTAGASERLQGEQRTEQHPAGGGFIFGGHDPEDSSRRSIWSRPSSSIADTALPHDQYHIHIVRSAGQLEITWVPLHKGLVFVSFAFLEFITAMSACLLPSLFFLIFFAAATLAE